MISENPELKILTDKAKPIQSGNPNSDEILDINHSVLDNCVCTWNIKNTYVDGYEPWLGILAAEVFSIFSTANRLKCYTPGQMIFGRAMILPIRHKAYWKLIYQQQQAQMNKNKIRDNK